MKQRKVSSPESKLVWLAAFTLFVATVGFAQEPVLPQMKAYSGVVPWTDGTIDDAISQAASGTTIPMSHYTFTGSRGTYKGVIVGGNPFGKDPDPVTINAVVIPLIIDIETTTSNTFDPTEPNSCDGGVSAETRFKESPLVVNNSLTFNGVNVGSHQYIDGFMRAEFWNATSASRGLDDPISWSFAKAESFTPIGSAFGIVVGTGCNQLGVVSAVAFRDLLSALILSLQASGVISPTKFAVFLLKNVVTSSVNPPTYSSNCCDRGYHGATGSPVQTYAVMSYDTTGRFAGVHDVTTASHEIGEWMNDPLGNNPTPAWGDIGRKSGCQSNFEVGDPLGGISMPVITLSGYDYHVQELAFFSWFFDAQSATSIGAGGKFSGNGTFTGPSKPCPPGGTY